MTDLSTRTKSGEPRPLLARSRAALGVAGELLLGARCLGCAEPGVGLCPECRGVVERRGPQPVLPQPCPDDFPLTIAAGPYDQILRQLISAHKDRQAWLLTGFLADRLAMAVRTVLDELDDLDGSDPGAGAPIARPVVLVPVPSASAAVRRRGRDATLAIARRASRRLGPEVTAVRALRPTRRMADQSGLDAVQRAANVRDGFRVTLRSLPRLLGARVVVVDDLATTGSSLLEATRALQRAGVGVVGAGTVAVTELRRRHRP